MRFSAIAISIVLLMSSCSPDATSTSSEPVEGSVGSSETVSTTSTTATTSTTSTSTTLARSTAELVTDLMTDGTYSLPDAEQLTRSLLEADVNLPLSDREITGIALQPTICGAGFLFERDLLKGRSGLARRYYHESETYLFDSFVVWVTDTVQADFDSLVALLQSQYDATSHCDGLANTITPDVCPRADVGFTGLADGISAGFELATDIECLLNQPDPWAVRSLLLYEEEANSLSSNTASIGAVTISNDDVTAITSATGITIRYFENLEAMLVTYTYGLGQHASRGGALDGGQMSQLAAQFNNTIANEAMDQLSTLI